MKFRVTQDPGFYDGRKLYPVGSVIETDRPSKTFQPLDQEAVDKLAQLGVKNAKLPETIDRVAIARERVAEAEADLASAKANLTAAVAAEEAKKPPEGRKPVEPAPVALSEVAKGQKRANEKL